MIINGLMSTVGCFDIMARQLVMHGGMSSTSSIPSPAKRLLGKRREEAEPTLVFCEKELEVADKMFSRAGSGRGTWKRW